MDPNAGINCFRASGREKELYLNTDRGRCLVERAADTVLFKGGVAESQFCQVHVPVHLVGQCLSQAA